VSVVPWPDTGESRFRQGVTEAPLTVVALATFIGYTVLAMVGLWLSRQPGTVATIWYANAAAIGVLVAQPLARVAVLLPAIGAANFLANLLFGDAYRTAAVFVPPNLLDIAVTTWVLNHTQAHARMLDSLAGFGRLMLYGIVLPPLGGATLGAVLLQATSVAEALPVWFAWWGGSALGGIALLPLALSLRTSPPGELASRLRAPLTWAIALLATGTTLVALLRLPFPFVYLALPLVIAAVVDRFVTVAGAVFITSLTTCVLIGKGLFVPPPFTAAWENVLFYLPQVATFLPALLLSVSVEQLRVASETRYRRLYERLQVTLHSIADAVITADPRGRIQYMNPVAEALTGWTAARAEGRRIDDVFCVIGGPDRAPVADVMKRALAGDASDASTQIMLVDRSGREIAIEESLSPIRSDHGELLGAVVVFRDVSDARAMANRLSRLAQHDALTDLPNRSLLMDRLAQTVRFAQRSGACFAVLFVDLDDFKTVNDTQGHAVGDALLRAVADRLVGALRGSDTVARLGGDEFVVVLSHVDGPEDAQDVARKLLAVLSEPHVFGERHLVVTPSIGIALYPRDGADAATLLENADRAMYLAKSGGRRRCETYDATKVA
jgi:diguanylate cyclase (GGDEF)-like protein/PAS domain S-box-containing protein